MRGRKTGFAFVLIGTAAAVAAGASAAQHNPRQTERAIASALANPARADQAVDDARRKPAEALAFAGVGPGDTVIDYLPGRGYWTRILTGVVGPAGHVYAYFPAIFGSRAGPAVAELDSHKLANMTTGVQPTNLPASPEPVDLFWTVENYHDIANIGPDGAASLAAFNKAVFATLKPGGTYVVIDHADAAGTGLADTKTLHRIDPAAVKQEVLAAGFQFVGESAALANPADDHLKPVFDPSIRGHTDQFIYKFRRPR